MMKKNKFFRLIVGRSSRAVRSVLASVFLFTAVVLPQTTPTKMTVEKWREDLRYMAAELPQRHKNLFHTMTREQFDAAVKQLDARIPSLTDNQVAMELGRIVSMVADGHTRLIPPFEPSLKFRLFPLKTYFFKEGVFIQAADKTYVNAVGGRIVSIGGVPVEQVVAKLAPYIPRENDMGLRNVVTLYMNSPEVLQASGIVSDPENISFGIEKDGKVRNIQIKPGGLITELTDKPVGTDWIDARTESTNPTPLWMKVGRPGYWGESGGYWYEYDKDHRLLYVQLNQIQDKPDKTIAAFMQEVEAFAKSNDVNKLVLDLRLNGGGNNGLVPQIIRPIIRLEKIDQRGHFFVIIGRQTFSAAQNLVNSLEKNTNAVFVGEPTGSHVNMYGDARRFTLPNSKLTVRASTLWHQDNIELDKRTFTAPQVSAALTFADYRQNTDTAMQAILNYKLQKSLREIAMELFEVNDLKSFRAKALEFKNDPVNEYQSVEADINTFGYRLAAMQKMDDAIEMLKINTELYPESANAFDSLGEAYATAGKRDEAIKSYEKALKIDPGFASSRDALRKLKGN
ncbi:MAG: S41 family peptidase [Pyrinomonadaceae bacterium]